MNRLTTCLLVAAGLGAALASDIPPPREVVDVAALVKQLGSENFAEREAATRRLSTLDVGEVPPELLAALESESPEIRERAAKAVKALRAHIASAPERNAIARLPRGERFARRGQIDLYVASTAASDYKPDDPCLWEPALQVGRAAIKKADMTGDRLPQGCPGLLEDIAEYKKAHKPLFTRVDEPYTKQQWRIPEAIQAPAIVGGQGFNRHVVAVRGPIQTGGSQMSLILATGDIDSRDNISCSVVICDGDVRVGANVFKSLIVARGSISIKGTTSSNTLIAGGTVTVGKPRAPAGGGFEMLERDIVEEHATKALGYITFFELSAVGVEVKVAEKAVTVAKVAEGKAFAAAGVKVGDVVAEVNGKKPDSAESLRRLLRDALALGDATLTLKRGDKTATVKVSLPE
jgi:hypothetical protein